MAQPTESIPYYGVISEIKPAWALGGEDDSQNHSPIAVIEVNKRVKALLPINDTELKPNTFVRITQVTEAIGKGKLTTSKIETL